MEDFLRATQSAVLDNTAKALAMKMGLSHMSLLQRANPDNDSHQLTIAQLFGILLHSEDMRPLEALAAAFGYELKKLGEQEAVELSRAILNMHAEMADVTRAVTDALADGRITRAERAEIRQEIIEAKSALDTLLNSVAIS